jgi:hypothetical protein
MSEKRFRPLEVEPVSVHPPFITYPSGHYRHEPTEERRAALDAALAGVALGAYDQRFLRWLSTWDIATVASVVSLLWRARAASTHPGEGEGLSGVTR